MRQSIALLALLASLGSTLAATEAPDTAARAHRLRPLEVMGVKQTPSGGIATEAVTRISGSDARRLGIEAPKGVSLVAPNFYMPDYGSRMTSSIYVRGLGARIDQPVVGLSVDNIPYLNKDNYDFDIADIESIEVLRGAQSVLNGRNTMGGQINIRTLSPLRTKGWRAMVEYGSANTASASAAYYGRIADGLGMSLSARYRHTDGFFRNGHTGKKLDNENSGSLRWKTAWQPSPRLSMSNTAVLTVNCQGGYPYALLPAGTIAYNDTCAYRRTAFADGLTVAWAGKRVVVTSVTSVQYLDDKMTLDQDFTTADYFTLVQDRREWSLTEDLFTRGARGDYSWLGGVFGFYRRSDMDAPVTFKDTGIAQLIEKHRNDANPDYPISWDTRRFTLGSNFTQSAGGFALYHESAYALGRWRFEAGLRLDIERTMLDYRSHTSTGYTTLYMLPGGGSEIYSHTPVDIDDRGSLSHTFVELLPKLTISYDFEPVTPYFTFSKGYKAGGYNTQMFSDVLQQRIMAFMGMSSAYELDDIVAYDPERSFNYEMGIHSRPIADVDLSIDGALFYIDCRNQQLTTFPAGNTTGRIMTNAGRTRSFGTELSSRYRPTHDLSFALSYGFTNATFRTYNDGRADYRGKRVPYAPAHTLFAEASYRATPLSFLGVTPSVTATARCVGDIYWNEANTVRQPFYCLPSLSLAFNAEHWSLRLWADNITDTRYDVFYFVSMSREFVQRGAPRRFGASFRLTI
ncbi:MAG: TonB-dependent receptor [Muribaculaceae bacterium]|nr:TonB-dependent receptor [Muribaculaceae bacterium]